MAQVMERDVRDPSVSCCRVEAAPLNVAVAQAPADT
jgi:hypothetical protein